MTSPSIFESFNARSLNPAQVAESFVPPDEFATLLRRRHSLVLGPRGSGKTTLLKMLVTPALERWEHPDADALVGAVDFSGIFVPFDRSWRAQLDAIGGHALEEDVRVRLGEAAFTVHTLRALIATFSQRTTQASSRRTHRRVALVNDDEERLCTLLARQWSISGARLSFDGLRSALGERLGRIDSLAQSMALNPAPIQRERASSQSALFVSALQAVSTALDAWQEVLHVPEEKWALLFDELELAPVVIKHTLFRALRSTDSRLVFKLALSPYEGDLASVRGSDGPQEGEDYDEIDLWYSSKRDTHRFCAQLWAGMLKQHRLPETPPKASFGRSRFDTPPLEWTSHETGTAYHPGSAKSRKFSHLALIDPSFRKYLADNSLDARHLDRPNPRERASLVRKIGPLVEARLFFLRQASGTRPVSAARRSRKRMTLYTGWETICAVTEGNPRWFIGLVDKLLTDLKAANMRVSLSRQAEAIEDAAARFRAALRTYPVGFGALRSQRDGLLALVDAVGSYFRHEQIDKAFSSEPAGTFVVDDRTDPRVLEAVGQAINAGAFVFVSRSELAGGVDQVTNKRVRLSYLLCASYGLIPRLSREVALSHVLADRAHHSIGADLTLDL